MISVLCVAMIALALSHGSGLVAAIPKTWMRRVHRSPNRRETTVDRATCRSFLVRKHAERALTAHKRHRQNAHSGQCFVLARSARSSDASIRSVRTSSTSSAAMPHSSSRSMVQSTPLARESVMVRETHFSTSAGCGSSGCATTSSSTNPLAHSRASAPRLTKMPISLWERGWSEGKYSRSATPAARPSRRNTPPRIAFRNSL